MMGERGQLEKMLGAQCFSFSLIGSQDNLYKLVEQEIQDELHYCKVLHLHQDQF